MNFVKEILMKFLQFAIRFKEKNPCKFEVKEDLWRLRLLSF